MERRYNRLQIGMILVITLQNVKLTFRPEQDAGGKV